MWSYLFGSNAMMKTTIALTIDWTLVIAVYGAVMSTATIVWDVWKWKHSGPDLSVDVTADMKSFNIPAFEGMTLITARVTNRGDRPTTITHYTLHHYPSRWARLRHRPDFNAIVTMP